MDPIVLLGLCCGDVNGEFCMKIRNTYGPANNGCVGGGGMWPLISLLTPPPQIFNNSMWRAFIFIEMFNWNFNCTFYARAHSKLNGAIFICKPCNYYLALFELLSLDSFYTLRYFQIQVELFWSSLF